MKKIILILVFMFPFTSIAEELKLLTWNVYMLPRPLNFTKQNERTKLIGEKLLTTDYDVILLQEAFMSGFRKKISKALKEKYPYQDHLRKSKRILHFVNSGLYVASKYPFEVLGWHYFNSCTHSDCFSSKGVLLIEVTTPKGNKVQIAMSHMQAWNDDTAVNVRKQQIEEINNLLKSYSRPEIPQILAGDLNIDGKIEKEYPGAVKALEMTSTPLEGELNATNGFAVECYKTPGEPGEGEWLDHIWLKQNDTQTEILNKKVIPFLATMKDKECSLSDHYGVEATLKL